MGQFIRDNDIYSIEFENTVPATLTLLVSVANALHIPDVAEAFVESYKEIGKCLIMCDNDANDTEINDYNIYIKMLERYLDENLDSRKGAASGFVKTGGSVSSPSKSGVTAPKKG